MAESDHGIKPGPGVDEYQQVMRYFAHEREPVVALKDVQVEERGLRALEELIALLPEIKALLAARRPLR